MRTDLKKLYFERALLKKYKKRPPRRLPRVLYPERIEDAYRLNIDEIVRFMKGRVDARIKPLLPKLTNYYSRTRTDADEFDATLGDLADELEQVRIETVQAYTPEELRRLAQVTGDSVAAWNARQMNGQLKGIVEVDMFGGEPWIAREMGAFVVQNVNLITSIETEYLSQVQNLIATSVRSGMRSEDIASELEDRYDVSRSRAELIARDQVGKFQGQLTELRQTDLGIEAYIWRDSGDARVRETHHANNGKRFTWDDPPAETGHPGEDYQCRCGAEPDLANFFETSDS